MRAVVLEVPLDWLDDRRRRGADRRDEMWDGELHMVPPPSGEHQRVSGRLYRVLAERAEALDLEAFMETGLFRPGVGSDYRVPDQVYARPDLVSGRGVDGPAQLVVEVRSPGDETDAKLDWYASLGVEEVLVVDPSTRTAEVFRRSRTGRIEPVPTETSPGLALWLATLQIRVETVSGPRLHLSWEDGTSDI